MVRLLMVRLLDWGGLVLEDSFQRGEGNNVSFVITDLKSEINICILWNFARPLQRGPGCNC